MNKQNLIGRYFKRENSTSLLNEKSLFQKVIVQGCWPLDPMATWLISSLNEILQNRSSIAIIKATLDAKQANFVDNQYYSISAVELAQNGLIEEFSVSEKYNFSIGKT